MSAQQVSSTKKFTPATQQLSPKEPAKYIARPGKRCMVAFLPQRVRGQPPSFGGTHKHMGKGILWYELLRNLSRRSTYMPRTSRT
jgi:hypothetical protein